MKTVDDATPATLKAWNALVTGLDGAALGSMFGMPCIKGPAGKAIAGLFGNAVCFKLEGPEHAAALALKSAELFDPSGSGRPMRQWVVVPFVHAKLWPHFGTAAMAPNTPSAPPAKAPKAPAKKRPTNKAKAPRT